MKLFNTWSLKSKLLLIPALGSASFIIFLALSTWVANTNMTSLQQARDLSFPMLEAAAKSVVLMDNVKETLSTAVTTGESEMLTDADMFNEQLSEMLQNMLVLSEKSKTSREAVDEIRAHFKAYFREAEAISSGMIEGTVDFTTLGERSDKMNTRFDAAYSGMISLKSALKTSFNDAIDKANSSAQWLIVGGIGMGVFTVLLLFALSAPVIKSIRMSLKKVITSLENMSQDNGDLTVRLTAHTQDEIGDLATCFNRFLGKLQHTVTEVVETSGPLSELAGHINALSQKNNDVVSLQNKAMQIATMSMESMNDSVAVITRHGQQASDVADKATHIANAGGDDVSQTIESIGKLSTRIYTVSEVITRLSQDTEKVSEVFEVIRSIAEQTNLLALNAAIEAARAGEQGRGFAVVADEVRNLASRAQRSTDDIEQTIKQLQSAATDAVEAIKKGDAEAKESVESAKKASSSIEAMLDSIADMRQMNIAIAQASTSQQSVSTSLSASISDMDEKVHETFAHADSLSHAGEKINELAMSLQAVSEKFNV